VAVRDVLRRRADLRDAYAAVKRALADDPAMDMERYLAGKSEILQQVLAESDVTDEERREIRRLNNPRGLLRPMTESDVLRVVAVQEPGAVLGLAEVFPQDAHPFPREEIAQRWRAEIADPRIDCYVVAPEQDGVAGFAAIRADEFLHFGIAVEHWGSGLAQQAHDAVLEVLRHRGVDRAWLRVFTDNRRGRRFYEKLGWSPTGERTRSSYAPFPELLTYEIAVRS
jgi:RimJ/RimL family protein N-acetyltransferase